MRKLSALVLLAFLAAPALCLAASPGPADHHLAPKADVIWIAVGTTPMAVQAMPMMVTVCYFGTTVTVPEKIAERLLKVGAFCGSCERRVTLASVSGKSLSSDIAPGGVCGDVWIPLLAPKAANAEKVIPLDQEVK